MTAGTRPFCERSARTRRAESRSVAIRNQCGVFSTVKTATRCPCPSRGSAGSPVADPSERGVPNRVVACPHPSTSLRTAPILSERNVYGLADDAWTARDTPNITPGVAPSPSCQTDTDAPYCTSYQRRLSETLCPTAQQTRPGKRPPTVDACFQQRLSKA